MRALLARLKARAVPLTKSPLKLASGIDRNQLPIWQLTIFLAASQRVGCRQFVVRT
jgi:hypothetical protein